MNTATTVPEGYMQKGDGTLVPTSKVKPIDKMRNDLVNEQFAAAAELNDILKGFKDKLFGDFAAFVEISFEQYGAKVGGKKGNITLTSFDGLRKIQRAYAETLQFDERLQAAKELVDACISNWSEGANDNLRVLVNGAFEVNEEGKISTNKVLSLRQFDIEDDMWHKAMDAIADSVRVADVKGYVRLYYREDIDQKWQALKLDIASV